MATIKTASPPAAAVLKTAFLKTLVLKLFLLIGIAALPAFAFAVDTDADGVDDGVGTVFQNFEANLTDWQVNQVVRSQDGKHRINGQYGLAASSYTSTATLRRTMTFTEPTRLSWHSKKSGTASAHVAFSGGPVPACMAVSSYINHCVVTVLAGTHTFTWTLYLQYNPGGFMSFDTFNSLDDLLIAAVSVQDNCPSIANADQLNTDGDTQGNVCDMDDDNDAVADTSLAGTSDRYPLNAAASSDSDNDGFPDSWNAACDAVCQANSGLVLDNCPSSANPDQLNTDGDAQGNVCDTDDDNDGFVDTSDAFPLDNTQVGDIDTDGIDGFVDNCPSNSNADQFNTDGDAQGDVCDTDDDNDGVLDTKDNFPLDASRVAADSGILATFNGVSAGDGFGKSISAAGDVNGDGYADVIVGAWQDDNNGTDSGSATVLSGANGVNLYTFIGGAGSLFGSSVSDAGDVNNDGFADVIVGAYGDATNGWDSGRARVLSGANGAVLYTFNGDSANDRFGYSVSGAGDVNNDGFADVVVGAYQDGNNGSGSARVFSGANGAVLYTFNGDGTYDDFGTSVSGAGDVNNDGYDDVIVGADGDDNNGSASGSARVFSGANGAILYTFNGGSIDDQLGYSVSAAGDVNNDGFADVIVGAPYDDNNGSSSGSAQIFSGANGSILYAFNGDSASALLGSSVSAAGDVNNDGFADVIVGAPNDDNNGGLSGSARVFSGANGAVLYAFNGDTASDYFGQSVSGAGDVNNDGFADVIVGAHLDDNAGEGSGSARIFSGKAFLTDFDGDGIVDSLDADDDNDNVVDINDYAPLNPLSLGDSDNDGIDGFVDNCPSNANADQLNTDGDAQGNVCDSDDDNDGVADTSDKFPLNGAASSDTDVDGFPGSWNAACDAACQANSGLVLDNCPSITNANQLNTDGDAQGNVCDSDDDNDGVADTADAFPLNAAETLDTDLDGSGNNADPDDDNDGLSDVMDPLPLQAKFNLNAPYKGSQVGDQNAVQ